MIGRIYRIIHLESNICYIGSTMNELRFRWQEHKDHYKQWLKKGNQSEIAIYPYFKKHGVDKFKMILIKEYEVVDRNHLQAYEQLYIEKFRKNAVNVNSAFSILHLYRIANKENIVCKKKDWYEDNKERLIVKARQYRQVNKEKIKKYCEDNKEKKSKQGKEWYEANKETINEKRKEKFVCECGGRYIKINKSHHLKSKKHQAYITSQNDASPI
jgi:hypothetical protein